MKIKSNLIIAAFLLILTHSPNAMEKKEDESKNERHEMILQELREDSDLRMKVINELKLTLDNNNNGNYETNKRKYSFSSEEEVANNLEIIERETFLQLFQSSTQQNMHFMDFSDERFGEFFMKVVKINIFDDKYINKNLGYTSKLNRLKKFLDIEPNKTIGLLLESMLEKSRILKGRKKLSEEEDLYENAEKVISRLLGKSKKNKKNNVPEGMYN